MGTSSRGARIGLSFSLRRGMDKPSTVMLCRVVPRIRFKVVSRLVCFGEELGILQCFRKPASTARMRSRGTGQHGVRTRVTIQLDQSELQHLALVVIAGELIDGRHESFSGP